MKIGTLETLRAVVGGKERIIGKWRHPSGGRFAVLRGLAKAAVRAVEGYELGAQQIAADPRRSARAVAEDTQALARERLRELGQAQEHLTQEARKLADERARLAAVPQHNGDAAMAVIDVAIAERLRSMDAAERSALLLSGENEHAVAVALRLPELVTGISASMRRSVERALIERRSAEQAALHDDLAEAVEDAQEALRSGFRLLAEAAGIHTREQIEAAGAESWPALVRPIGAAEVMDYVAEQALGTGE